MYKQHTVPALDSSWCRLWTCRKIQHCYRLTWPFLNIDYCLFTQIHIKIATAHTMSWLSLPILFTPLHCYQRQNLGISSVDGWWTQPHTVSEPTSSKPLSPTPQPCTARDLDQTAPANKNEPVLIDCTQASPRHAMSALTKTTASGADCPEVSEVSVKLQDRALSGCDLPAQKPFLEVQELVNILCNASLLDIPQYVPRGSKENQYFVVNNSVNCDRRKHVYFVICCIAFVV